MKIFLPFIVLLVAMGYATGVPLQTRESENTETYEVDYLLSMMAVNYIAFMTGAIMCIKRNAGVKRYENG